MRYFTLALLCVAALAASARPADPVKAAPVDTSFLKRYAETRGFMLGRPTKPKITPDGKAVLFLRSEPAKAKQSLFEFDVATGKTRELLSPEALLKGAGENLSPEEKARRERQRVTVGGFANYQLDDTGKHVLLMLSGRVYVFDRGTGKARELKTGPGTIVDPKWSPNGKYVSYVRDYDVCVYDLSADKERTVTTGGTALKTHGLAEFVAQEEMGRFTGYWWSPDSTRIAYEEADHTGVEVWRIADPLRPGVAPREQFYPRPGKKNVSVRLGVVPIAGGETVWVKLPRPANAQATFYEGRKGAATAIGRKSKQERYEYLARVAWGNPGRFLLLVLQTRDQAEIGLAWAFPDTKTTELRTRIIVESGWLRVPSVPKPLRDTECFLMVTDWQNPEPDLGQYGGGFVRWTEAEELLGVLPDQSGAYVTGRPPLEHLITDHPDTTVQHVYRFEVGKENVPLTQAAGIHTAVVSDNCKVIAITSTTLKEMPRTTIQKADGAALGRLPSVAVEPGIRPNVEITDVGDYWTAIVRPRDFDATKKYPVIVHVYGGPKHLTVVRAMRNWLVPQWLADQGFIVVAIDNRGTPGRGAEWERAIYQKFGTVPLEDQVKGLHLLCDKYPELDRERVGIVGWSFGGYMAANAVLRRPDVFRAAVAGAPVTDWEDYDTHYTERYLGLLPESRKAYDEASLIPLAKNLRRPLLLVHGTADDNVYFRHTLKLANALFRAGKPFEVLPLPGITHMYTADPQVTERLWAKTVAFFKTHLGEAK